MSDGPPTIARVPTMIPRHVRLMTGAGVVEVASLPAHGRYVLGRAHEVEIVVRDTTVSRLHAAINHGPEGMTLTDLGSANGTRIGARTLAPNERHELATGQVFSLGDVVAVVYEGDSTARARWMVGRDGVALAIEHLIATSVGLAPGSEAAFSVGTLRGTGLARRIGTLVALAPPGATMASTGENAVTVLLPGVTKPAALAWCEAISALLARAPEDNATPSSASSSSARRPVATEVRAFPEDGRTVIALYPQDDVVSTAPRALPPILDVAPSAPMEALFDRVERVAASMKPVLIRGETGAGKRELARRIHERSKRSGRRVNILCGSLPESLLEAELFGYEQGAFPGAVKSKAGLIETAHGGTLVLEDIGQLSLVLQGRLLRVLEEKAVSRLGSTEPRVVDVRWIVTTGDDLAQAIREKRFWADLFYQLNTVMLEVPPLRQRRSEIAGLVAMFVASAAETLCRTPPRVGAEIVAQLERHDWPGNVRELRNTVERLVLLARDAVSAADLPTEIRSRTAAPAVNVATAPPAAKREAPVGAGLTDSLDDEMARIERAKILEVLEKCAGNQTRAAEMLGITRRALIGRMEKYSLPRPRR